jgi:CelD/BcsL family acetyltransferase involved in cellulose biosynthesis
MHQDPNYSPWHGVPHRLLLERKPHARTAAISLNGTFEEYWEARPRRLRQNIARALRHAKSAGHDLSFRVVQDPSLIQQSVRAFGELESLSWKADTGTAIGPENAQGRYYQQVFNAFSYTGQAISYELLAGQTVIARQLALGNADICITLKTTYDRHFSNLSPGRVLDYEMLRHEFSHQRFKSIELYTKADPVQMQWATDSRMIEHITCFKSPPAVEIYNLAAGISTLARRPRTAGPALQGRELHEALAVEVLPWSEGLRRSRKEWETLVGRLRLNPSLLPGWMDCAIRSHQLEDRARVCILRRNGKTTGIIPFVLGKSTFRGIPVRTVDFGSGVVAYHEQLICQEPAVSVLQRVLAMELDGQWDVFRISTVPDPSETAMALTEWAATNGFGISWWRGERSPYLRIDRDWQSYLKGQTKKFRANVTRVLRRPSEAGSAEMRWFEGTCDTNQLLADILVIEDASWKAAEGVAIGSRSAELEYHHRLLPYLAETGALFANVLYVNSRPVAYVLCSNHDGWVGQLKTSFDATVKDAGSAVVTASIMRAFELGAVEYDFLGESDAHKLKWTSLVREHRGCLVFARTTAGRAAAALQLAVNVVKAIPSRSRIQLDVPES